MPEGHTIHRYARLHEAALTGQAVTASSPQGRFVEGASRLNGSVLTDVEAYGKHLFYRFEPAGTLHVHLGLFGRFLLYTSDAPPPTDGTRLALATRTGVTLHLAGATIVELIDDGIEQQIKDRLGPDPLRDDADPAAVMRALRRRSVGIGQALLNQSVVAGIGNAYRSEVLFLAGVHPDIPARDVPADRVQAIWDLVTELLHAGARSGRIVTVSESDLDDAPAPGDPPVYVYRRAGLPCRLCGTTIESWPLGGRLVFACPQHQPR